uniref:RING-type domain-containing protein n=1 Tax=viral metagenome TaxID=1070528 RepID=A0A6C0C9Q2_9ZZZZ
MDDKVCCSICKTDMMLMDQLSCSHTICFVCAAQTFVPPNNSGSCPACGLILATDIKTMYDEFIKVPLNKLRLEHGFMVNDILWTYGGYNGNQWLYTRKQCVDIEEQYQKYADCSSSTESDLVSSSDDSFGLDDTSTMTLQLNVGNNTVEYVLNFENMSQYPKADASKTRSLTRIPLMSYDDITNNKIVGVSGKKF